MIEYSNVEFSTSIHLVQLRRLPTSDTTLETKGRDLIDETLKNCFESDKLDVKSLEDKEIEKLMFRLYLGPIIYKSLCEILWGWLFCTTSPQHLRGSGTRSKTKHHFAWIILPFWLKSAWFQFDCMHPSHCSCISTTINQGMRALPCSTKSHCSMWLQFGKERQRIVRNWAVGLQMKLRRNT